MFPDFTFSLLDLTFVKYYFLSLRFHIFPWQSLSWCPPSSRLVGGRPSGSSRGNSQTWEIYTSDDDSYEWKTAHVGLYCSVGGFTKYPRIFLNTSSAPCFFKKAENAILEQIFFRNLKLKPHELRILIRLYHIIHLPMFRIRFHYDADPDPRLH